MTVYLGKTQAIYWRSRNKYQKTHLNSFCEFSEQQQVFDFDAAALDIQLTQLPAVSCHLLLQHSLCQRTHINTEIAIMIRAVVTLALLAGNCHVLYVVYRKHSIPALS